MQWVTRQDVRLDRTACAWLILRHIDAHADIRYLDADDIPAAVQAGALPFHDTTAEDPDWGERTSFDLLLAEYKLEEHDPALRLLGEIVRGAELGEDPRPESPGLHAIVKGMKTLAAGDPDMVARMLPVFDALYYYCVRTATGQADWPAGTGAE